MTSLTICSGGWIALTEIMKPWFTGVGVLVSGVLVSGVLVSGVLVSGGCSSLHPPRVGVRGASISERGEEALGLSFQLGVINPNNEESVELRHVLYAVSIGGKPVYQGKRAVRLTLIPQAERRLDLPVVVRYDRMGWTGGTGNAPPSEFRYQITGELHYLMPGEIAEILLDTGVRKPHITFSGAGSVSLAGVAESSNPHNP